MSSINAASTVLELTDVNGWFRRVGNSGLLRLVAQQRGESPPSAHEHPNVAVSFQSTASSFSVVRRMTPMLLVFWLPVPVPVASSLSTR